MLRLTLTACLMSLPIAAFAVGGGSNDDTPPTPTNTTIQCPEGYVYNADTELCVLIQDSGLDDDALYGAVRELAYAERYEDAQTALSLMSDQAESRVMTYRGFIARRLGDPAASELYDAALAADPNNLLARAYYGMSHVEAGDMAEARLQLAEIRARGGAGSWPDQALSRAIRTGVTTNY